VVVEAAAALEAEAPEEAVEGFRTALDWIVAEQL